MPLQVKRHIPHGTARTKRPPEMARESPSKRGYGRDWKRLRREHLEEYPLCVECLRDGQAVVAVEVDHVVPIRRDPDRRMDPTNLQSLCHSHHSRKTNRERRHS